MAKNSQKFSKFSPKTPSGLGLPGQVTSKSGFWDLRAASLTRLRNFLHGNRAGFQLHLGRQSQGCITGDITDEKVASDYDKINDMLTKDLGQNSLEVVE